MKNIKNIFVIALITLTGLSSYAQQPRRKMTLPNTSTQTPMMSSYAPSVSSEVTGLLGLTAGAFHLGVDYIRTGAGLDWGGYFFMQSSKDKNSVTTVSQAMALGAMVRVSLLDNSKWRVFVAPGFGVNMVKDGSISTAAKKSDESIIGPSFKLGVQLKMAPQFLLGLEKTQFYNMLNDNVNNYVGPSEYYSVAGTFQF